APARGPAARHWGSSSNSGAATLPRTSRRPRACAMARTTCRRKGAAVSRLFLRLLRQQYAGIVLHGIRRDEELVIGVGSHDRDALGFQTEAGDQPPLVIREAQRNAAFAHSHPATGLAVLITKVQEWPFLAHAEAAAFLALRIGENVALGFILLLGRC